MGEAVRGGRTDATLEFPCFGGRIVADLVGLLDDARTSAASDVALESWASSEHESVFLGE